MSKEVDSKIKGEEEQEREQEQEQEQEKEQEQQVGGLKFMCPFSHHLVKTKQKAL